MGKASPILDRSCPISIQEQGRAERAMVVANEKASSPEHVEQKLEIYKLLIEMADKVSERRQAANNFYLSINTLLLGGATYLGVSAPSDYHGWTVAVAGVMICWSWSRSIHSYRTLNDAKFKVINDLELSFSCSPFTDEWRHLDPDGDGKKHRPFSTVEKAVPRIFIVVYVFQALLMIDWPDALLFNQTCGNYKIDLPFWKAVV